MYIKYNNLSRIIGGSEEVFIIAEVGQNHQGDLETAKKLIKAAKECGATCVKFQKTDLEEKFNHLALKRPYVSPNSFGETYGKHKEYLEFSRLQFIVLQQYADEIGIFFTASAMDEKSFEFLIELNVPFVKIGSGDANNFLLIEKAAQANVPLIISTGMQNFDTVKQIYKTVSTHHKKFSLLHCVSAYPTPLKDINLNVLKLYQNEFPDISIGYSGHEIGTHISVAAVAFGSKIIERHITLSKNQKGSDHECSLEPEEFKQMVDNIRSLEMAIGQPLKKIQPSELPCYRKLGKTIVYSKSLPKGHKLGRNDLKIKVAEPKGLDGNMINSIYDRILIRDVRIDDSMQEADFY